MSPLTEVRVLTKARDLLLLEGWIKHDFTSTEGLCGAKVAHCALGAVGAIANGYDCRGRAILGGRLYKECARLLDAVTPRDDEGSSWPRHVIDYNDEDKTTLGDVIDVFDDAIELAKEHARIERRLVSA